MTNGELEFKPFKDPDTFVLEVLEYYLWRILLAFAIPRYTGEQEKGGEEQ